MTRSGSRAMVNTNRETAGPKAMKVQPKNTAAVILTLRVRKQRRWNASSFFFSSATYHEFVLKWLLLLGWPLSPVRFQFPDHSGVFTWRHRSSHDYGKLYVVTWLRITLLKTVKKKKKKVFKLFRLSQSSWMSTILNLLSIFMVIVDCIISTTCITFAVDTQESNDSTLDVKCHVSFVILLRLFGFSKFKLYH